MADLVAWLTQILDEDERAAKECAEVYPGSWELSDRGWIARIRADGPDFRVVAELEQNAGIPDGAFLGDRIDHIARHDPAAVLADIAAKRAIIAEYAEAREFYNRPANQRHPAGEVAGLETAIKHLASAYADRPGYDESWRP